MDEINSFLDTLAVDEHPAFSSELNFNEVVTEYAEEALRRDLENMPWNRNDREADADYLASIEACASRLGVASYMATEIELERQSQAERYGNEEIEPTSGGGVGWSPPSARYGAHRGEIIAMFQELA